MIAFDGSIDEISSQIGYYLSVLHQIRYCRPCRMDLSLYQIMEIFRSITGRQTTYAGASDVMSLLIGVCGNDIARLLEPETSRVNKAVRDREGG